MNFPQSFSETSILEDNFHEMGVGCVAYILNGYRRGTGNQQPGNIFGGEHAWSYLGLLCRDWRGVADNCTCGGSYCSSRCICELQFWPERDIRKANIFRLR